MVIYLSDPEPIPGTPPQDRHCKRKKRKETYSNHKKQKYFG